jgi:hypothetical protein
MKEDADPSLIDRLVAFDAQRESLPGEHWLAFGLGVYLLLRHRQSVAGRLVSMAAGALFIVRALTGRDGAIAALERRTQAGRRRGASPKSPRRGLTTGASASRHRGAPGAATPRSRARSARLASLTPSS